jgi:nitronate monooxygenase
MELPVSLRRIGVALPICQAPIGSLTVPALAAAVSNAGALGHLACTWRSPDELNVLFAQMATLTTGAYGANFVLDFPVSKGIATALDAGVRVISFFWGDGASWVPEIHATGGVAMQVVGSVREALRAAEAGFDIVVVQGREAGGHVRSAQALMTLLPEVVDALGDVPVFAAGGIADRRGVAASLALGARGVWVGTRFAAARGEHTPPLSGDASGRDRGGNRRVRTLRYRLARCPHANAAEQHVRHLGGSRPGSVSTPPRRG